MQFWYELYKILSRKLFFILLAAVFVLNGALFFSSQQDARYRYGSSGRYEALMARCQQMGPDRALESLTAVKARLDVFSQIEMLGFYDDPQAREEQRQQLLAAHPDEYAAYLADPQGAKALMDDAMLYEELLAEASYIVSYPDYINGIAEQAEQMQKISIFREADGFSFRNILKTPKDFEGLDELPLAFGRSDGILSAVTFRTTDALVLLMVFFVCAVLFLQEKENGTLILLRSAKNGRARLAFAKLGAVSAASLCIAALLYASVLAGAYFLYGGFGDLGRYVQSMQAFSRCTLPLTVRGYLLLFFFSKLAAVLLVAWVFAAVFSLSKTSGQAYLASGCILAANLAAYVLISPLSYFNLFKYLSFFELMDTHALYTQYHNINLFSFPVNRPAFSYAFAVLAAALAAAGTVRAFVSAPRFGGRAMAFAQRFARILPHPGGGVRLFAHECYKLLISGKALLLLLAAVLFTLYGLRQQELFLYSPEQIYVEYIDSLLGGVTDEKIAFIEQERADLDSSDEKIAALWEQVQNGSLPYNAYLAERTMLENAKEARTRPLELVEEQLSYLLYLKEARGIDGAFVNLRYTNAFFGNTANGQALSALVLFLAVLAASYPFCAEYQSGMIRIVTAAKHGKARLFAAKYGACALFAVLLWGAVFCRELVDMARYYPIGDLGVPIQSIERFAAIPVPVSIFGYLCLLYGLRLLGTLAACAVTLALSVFIKRRAFTVLFSALACVLPMLLALTGLAGLPYITLNGMFSLNELAAQPGGFAAALISAGAFCLLSAVLAVLAKRRFCNQERRVRRHGAFHPARLKDV